MIGAADPENRLKPLTPAICCRVALAARDSRHLSYASFGSLEPNRATHLHNRIIASECRILRLDRAMTYVPHIGRLSLQRPSTVLIDRRGGSVRLRRDVNSWRRLREATHGPCVRK